MAETTLEDVHDMARELQQWREAAKRPVAWTDAEELRSLEKFSSAWLYKVSPDDPHFDNRRQLMLYAAPPTITLKEPPRYLVDLGYPAEHPTGDFYARDDVIEAIRSACSYAGIQCVIEESE